MKISRVAGLVVAAGLWLVGCSCTADKAPPPISAACSTDADCVPASCCHATACVPKGSAPDCAGVMCTMNCEPDTIDCGGGCVCQSGACSAKLNDLGADVPDLKLKP